MKRFTNINAYTKYTKTAIGSSLSHEKYYSWYEVEKWTKKFLDAKNLKQSTVKVFGRPRFVRPPFQEHCIVSRFYGPEKTIPLIYSPEQIFPSSEGIPQN